jgi:glucose-1-phosphate thymidylyltransferase
MFANIKDILIISTPEDLPLFKRVLKDGKQWGVNFSYAEQPKPNGLAEAFIIGEQFIGDSSVCLILGDNLFFGNHLNPLLTKAREKQAGATLFGYEVKDPQRYGIVEFNDKGQVLSIEEKPKNPKSNYAVTGLYFYDNQVVDIAKKLKPSARGELEITDVNNEYLKRGQISVNLMGRGFTWLDAGTYDSLMQAHQFVQVIEERQGLCVASPEEIAYRQNFISKEHLIDLGKQLGKSPYGQYLVQVAERGDFHGSH